MAECRDCEDVIQWCEIANREGALKKIPMDPKPNPEGDYTMKNVHRDLPLRVAKVTPDDRRNGVARFTCHRDTCPERDPEEQKKYNRDPSWVREPEGY